jgi:hypothetical protein
VMAAHMLRLLGWLQHLSDLLASQRNSLSPTGTKRVDLSSSPVGMGPEAHVIFSTSELI